MSMLTNEKKSLVQNIAKAKAVAENIEVSKLQLKEDKSFDNLRRLQAILEKARDQISEYPRTELRAKVLLRIDKVYNSTSSALDLLDRDEFSKKDTEKYIAKVTSRLNKIGKAFSSLEVEKANALKNKSEGSTAKKGISLAGKGIFDHYNSKDYEESPPKDDAVLKAINNSQDIISHYQKFARELPATEADSMQMGDFIINRMPIVALTDPAVSADEFGKAGFITKTIGFYAVLENQLVLGVHDSRLKAKKMDPKTYAKFVLQKIERETHAKYQIIGAPTGYKNSGYIYYWLVPEKNIDQLRTRTRKALNVKRWYFAFK